MIWGISYLKIWFGVGFKAFFTRDETVLTLIFPPSENSVTPLCIQAAEMGDFYDLNSGSCIRSLSGGHYNPA